MHKFQVGDEVVQEPESKEGYRGRIWRILALDAVSGSYQATLIKLSEGLKDYRRFGEIADVSLDHCCELLKAAPPKRDTKGRFISAEFGMALRENATLKDQVELLTKEKAELVSKLDKLRLSLAAVALEAQ